MGVILVIPTDGLQLDHMTHALESWERYGPAIDHIIVVGRVADIEGTPIAASAILWSVPQPASTPQLNNQRNLTKVLDNEWAEDTTFIWTYDDIFLTKKTTLEELDHLSRCGLQGPWHFDQKTFTTLQLLTNIGRPATNYELHLPLVIRPQERERWVGLMPMDNRLQLRTWVMNHLEAEPAELIEDVRITPTTTKLPTLGIYSTASTMDPLPHPPAAAPAD